MLHIVLPVGMLQCNCSLLADEAAGEAIIVDPGDGQDVERLLGLLREHKLTLKMIVVTHAHIDHIGGAAKLKQLTGGPVYMNANDQDLYSHLDRQAQWLGMPTPPQTEIDQPLRDGDTLTIGGAAGSETLEVRYTPGHTQGSVCLLLPQHNLLLAGDTLFRDSIGRTDLPGGDGRQILVSIHDKLLTLPDETNVIPGHGPATTIGRERERNPFLR